MNVKTIMANTSYSSLDTRMEELSRQLKQKDEQLDQELDDAIQASFDEMDEEIESDEKKFREGLGQRVEAVKKGIRDRKDDLRQRVEAVKNGPKDRARKEAENALNRMEEDLSNEDLESAHVDRWVANQWLKASK
jgi:SPX domain protein involved in polyphosphate accumulation